MNTKKHISIPINPEIADVIGYSYDIKISIDDKSVGLTTPTDLWEWKVDDYMPKEVHELLYHYLDDEDETTSDLRKVLVFLGQDYDIFIKRCQEI